MVNLKKLFLIILILNVTTAYSYVDLNLSYTLSKRVVEGTETTAEPEPGSAEITSQGATVNWAWYIWNFTALEFNYGQTEELLKDNRKATSTNSSGDEFTILEVDSKVTTEIAGIGIRQSFAGRKSAIQPTLSIGYAQYTTSGTTKYKIEEAGVPAEFELEQDTNVFSSGYIAFALRFKLTELMGLTASAKAVMPEFDTSEAQNNVTYSAGFSWIF